MESHTPAFRLLCACCRWPSSEGKTAAIAEAAASDVDWNKFQRLVTHHRVTGQVNQSLREAAIPLSEEFSAWLSASSLAVARRGLVHLRETLRLQNFLAKSGIDILVIKGIAIGQKIYGSVGIKTSCDIDLLLEPQHVEGAVRLLLNDGYHFSTPAAQLNTDQIAAFVRYAKEFELRKDGGLTTEIHWHLTDNTGLLNDRAIDRGGQTISFGRNLEVRTLADEDLVAYLCAHGAMHNWRRLKWLTDLNALLAHATQESLVRYNAHASALGAKWCITQAHLLCDTLFGTDRSHSMDTAKSRQALRLKHRALAHMTQQAPKQRFEPVRMLRIMYEQVQLGEGRTFWREFLRINAVQPTVILELSLPTRYIALYPVIRPFFWLWFRWLSPRGRYRWNGNSVDTTT